MDPSSTKKSFLDINAYNRIFERETLYQEMRTILTDFERKCKQLTFKKGIYIYGAPGSGKTTFITTLLHSLNYDIIAYDAGDVRNKLLIESIASNNMSNRNVIYMMERKMKKIAIVMDEIDGMNGGDKGGINALIKLIRQKRTKKQKLECETNIPILCIGNYRIDKKIKELMKVCHVFEMKTPTPVQLETVLCQSLSSQFLCIQSLKDKILKDKILAYVQGDLRKLEFILQLCRNYLPETKSKENIEMSQTKIGEIAGANCFFGGEAKNDLSCQFADDDLVSGDAIRRKIEDLLDNIFIAKSYSSDSKKLVHALFQTPAKIHHHERFVTDTERTIVSLLFHENVLDVLKSMGTAPYSQQHFPSTTSPETGASPARVRSGESTYFYKVYFQILQNICFADFIERVTFQNQVWAFNEMSFLVKTFYNSHLLHEHFPRCPSHCPEVEDIRFTKILTKYSTEYNNQLFICKLCQELKMDKKDLFSFFTQLRKMHGENFTDENELFHRVFEMFHSTNITKLDIKRIYRFLDRNSKQEASSHDIFEEEFENNNGIVDPWKCIEVEG